MVAAWEVESFINLSSEVVCKCFVFVYLKPPSYLLVWNVDAKTVRAGKLVHMARAVGAVLELISCIGAVSFPITHKV